jgi:preprotein translocase subunit SecD
VWANQNDVESARVQKDLKGDPMILLTLDKRAAARVRDLTAKNIGNSVGIVLNGELVVVPVIKAPTGEIPIQADFAASEAEAIAAAFNRRAGRR